MAIGQQQFGQSLMVDEPQEMLPVYSDAFNTLFLPQTLPAALEDTGKADGESLLALLTDFLEKLGTASRVPKFGQVQSSSGSSGEKPKKVDVLASLLAASEGDKTIDPRAKRCEKIMRQFVKLHSEGLTVDALRGYIQRCQVGELVCIWVRAQNAVLIVEKV